MGGRVGWGRVGLGWVANVSPNLRLELAWAGVKLCNKNEFKTGSNYFCHFFLVVPVKFMILIATNNHEHFLVKTIVFPRLVLFQT